MPERLDRKNGAERWAGGASWVILSAVRNAAECSDRHRCLKNSNPARAFLRRREGPRQSGGIFADSH